jgi:Uma2 family endonuclease
MLNGFSPFPRTYTVEDYEQLERITGLKYHYINGKVFEMPGGSIEHGGIASNIIGELRATLRGTGCRVLTSDVKIYIDHKVRLYPDVTVVCGDLLVAPGEALQNPVLVVEVLSPSTADFDKGEKFELYKQIESLRHVLFVEQDRAFVQHYAKNEADEWEIAGTFDDLMQSVPLSLKGKTVALALAEVYDLVEFA